MEILSHILLNKFRITLKGNQDFPFLNKYGLIDNTGKTVLKPMYHAIWKLNQYLIGYRLGARFGILDKAGKVVMKPVLKAGHYVKEVKKHEEFFFSEEFYCDIELENDFTGSQLRFTNDINRNQVLISNTGEVLSDGEFEIIAKVSPDGYCLVANNDKWGLYDMKKRMLIIDTILPHGQLSYGRLAERTILLTLGQNKYGFDQKKGVFDQTNKR